MRYSDYLREILDHKRDLIKRTRSVYDRIQTGLATTTFTRYALFEKMIARAGQLNLIAEIKKASPSKGLIRESFDVNQIAKVYIKEKAAAISVLTEDKFFLGSMLYLRQLSKTCELPLLMKDFIIDVGQIYEAKYHGASAILLIVNILDEKSIAEFIKIAATLDLDCLVEVHSEDELKKALNCNAQIIGVNNRNLHTFEVDLGISKKLIPKIPESVVSVSESGIRSHEDIVMLQGLGTNAVLIGETFMREEDIGQKIKDVMNAS